MNAFLVLLAIVLLILVYKVYLLANRERFTEEQKEKEEEVPKVARPFVNLYDNFGKPSTLGNIIVASLGALIFILVKKFIL